MPESRIVYSTDGRQRQDLRTPEPERPPRADRRPLRPAKQPPSVPADGIVRIFRERGGRGGKVVSVIRGLPERGEALERLAGELKRQCGAGGAVKERAVEVQGDHRERLARLLAERGYTVKLAGG
jgi:translation initiation factor 1